MFYYIRKITLNLRIAIRLICLLAIMLAAGSINVSAAEMVSLTLNYDGRDHAYNNYSIALNVNGSELTGLDVPAVILDGRTYAPVRHVFEAMGGVVDYNDQTNQVYIGMDNDLVMLTIDSREMNINGKIVTMEMAPKIINGRTMVPVRFAAEALNFTVDWVDASKTAFISSGSQSAPNSDAGGAPLIDEGAGPSVSTGLDTSSNSNAPSGISTANVPIDSQADPLTTTATENTIYTGKLATDVSGLDIPDQQQAATAVTGFALPTESQPGVYSISASSAISKVRKTLMADNRLVVDIYNAELSLSQTTYQVGGAMLKSVRAGQNVIDSNRVARFVFDLTSPVEYTVSISADRRTVYVGFEQNRITGLSFSSDGLSDMITIEGAYAPVVSLFQLTEPDRLVIDLSLSMLEASVPSGSGVFASALRVSQYDQSTVRVVADLSDAAAYSVSYSGNKTIVKLYEPSFRNIVYSTTDRVITLAKTGETAFAAGSVVHADNYVNGRYTLTLPGDFSVSYGYGEYLVNDGYIANVSIETANGETSLTINENRILAVSIYEDASNYYISLMLPKEKYSKIVYLDPGHGDTDPGAIGLYGVTEKEINLDIALRVAGYLEADGSIKYYMSRVSDTYPALEERAQEANETADVFVSIHHNSFNGVANGTEVYYYPHDNDAALGFSGKNMSGIFQENMIEYLQLADRGAKTAKYVVLKKTTIPAVLVEVGFIDVETDAAKLVTEEYRDKAAYAIYLSIVETFGQYDPKR